MAASAQMLAGAFRILKRLRCEDEAVFIVMWVGLMGVAIGRVEGRGSWSLLLGELQGIAE